MPRVSGFVVEQFSNRPLPGATVIVGGSLATAGANGGFSVEISPGVHQVRAVMRGFKEFNSTVSALQDAQLNIVMQPVLSPL